MGLKPYSLKAGIISAVVTCLLVVVIPFPFQGFRVEANNQQGAVGQITLHLPVVLSNSTTIQDPGPTGGTAVPTTAATQIPTVSILAAGDIAAGGAPSHQTADLVESLQGSVLTLGDNAYPNGSAQDFMRNFDPTWGRFKDRIYPSPGNHDFNPSTGETGYFDYFKSFYPDPAVSWYSFNLGSWHLISLNSNCWTDTNDAQTSCAAGSLQETWLRNDLAAHPTKCTLAYWHAPLFNSGAVNPPAIEMKAIWQDLYNAGVDVVLNGHAHSYERFLPQDPDGNVDPQRGIVEIVSGTGGNNLEGFRSPPAANSVIRSNQDYGVLQMSLSADGYTYQFIPVPGGTGFTDSGSGKCH